MQQIPLTHTEFSEIQRLIYQWAGIYMTESKKALISGRLMKRLRHYELTSYADYIRIVKNPQHADEKQIMINQLTTNETYFFREPKHFEWLRARARKSTADVFSYLERRLFFRARGLHDGHGALRRTWPFSVGDLRFRH
jgi:chemotaxis methyl-accepting protein methylase